ncbi:ATP-binding protein [Melittangium boletus]|uniref:histidine kinase n=1 Tax=Melittangium boletus DSM 14713 TaxID=1294270 RepID=A0A250IGC7_9BACT|nr:ATP-binding protein [Melittangium boletus]ATB30207.1 hypothetical protein MEBOL_003667 [Melittangium boletus DSM 14713]
MVLSSRHPRASRLGPAALQGGLALLVTGLAFLVDSSFPRGLASSPSFLLLAAVLGSAWWGGLGPALLATAASIVLPLVFSGEPLVPSSALISGVFFAGLAVPISWAARHVRTSLQAAQRERHVLSLTLRTIGEAVISTDSQGLVRFINPVAVSLTGWSISEALGQPLARVLSLVDPSTQEPVPPHLCSDDEARSISGGHLVLLRSRSGAELSVEHVAIPLAEFPGGPCGSLVVFRDISARFREEQERAQLLAREHDAHLQVEAQRKRLETLFLQAPVAICLTRGAEHIVELVNPLCRTLVGDHLRPGHAVRDTVSGLDLHLLDEVFRTGMPFVGHEVPLLADYSGTGHPEVKYFDFTLQPWRGVEGDILGIMGVCAEVTEQVLVRREMETLTADLQKALQIRDDFLSVASHELKTPLTSLQLQLQLLWRSLPETDAQGRPHPARQRIEATRRPAERLHKLVNTLLDVSRIRADRLALEPETVDVAALLRDVVARAEADAVGAGCTLHLAPSPPIVGHWDRLRLEQVVTNLLSNAIKYGASHPVELAVHQEGAVAHLTVRDHGIGIGPEDQARIFQRFERAVSERHYGGFGLGLWICKQIVDSLGGDIRVRSQPGQGATFTVSLPLAPPARPRTEGVSPVAV